MIQKPNLVYPLTPSYNTRGVAAYTNAAAGTDQRKINCYYEFVRGAGGNITNYLSKRPGVSINAGTFGANTQVGFLIVTAPTLFSLNDPWAIVKDGTAIKAVSSAAATTILTSADYNPFYADRTDVSGTETVVVQLCNNTTITAVQRVYYSSSIGTWTEITDGDFTSIVHRGKMEFMDGYAFVLGADRRIYQSDLNSLSSWTSGNYITKSITQDVALGLARFKNQLLAFGEDTCEVFYNAGNASGSILGRSPTQHRSVGLGQIAVPQTDTGRTHYYTIIGERMYILARAPYGAFVNQLWAYDGARFEKVSTSIEDKLLSQGGVYSINKVNFAGQQAVAIQMTAPSATTQKWLMFFPENGGWFEWSSAKYGPVNNGYWFLGCGSSHKLYNFPQSDIYQDDTTNYEMQVAFTLPKDHDEFETMDACGVISDNASATANLAVSFSDNDYVSFTTARNIDISLARKAFNRCGTYRKRAVKLSYTGSSAVRLQKFYAVIR